VAPTPSPTGAIPGTPAFYRLRVGDVLDSKWRLESKLGAGGMGAVFLAHDLTLDRKVAIKVLAGQLCGDEEFTERFEREARLTAKLEHPNIVPVFAVGRFHNRPFIAMKALEGVTLARLLNTRATEKKPFSREELLPLLRQLCAGLGFIHSKGYVHRDIKAGNVFVSPEGHVTLLDFGVLRDTSQKSITRAGALLGTPHYVSPEQALGVRDLDGRADLYGVGVLMFECLALRPPFTGDPLSLMHAHVETPPPDLCALVPELPKAAGQVVAKALSKKPGDRFSTAAELFNALEVAWGGPVQPLTVLPMAASPMTSAPAAVPPTPARMRLSGVGVSSPLTPAKAAAGRSPPTPARLSSNPSRPPTPARFASNPSHPPTPAKQRAATSPPTPPKQQTAEPPAGPSPVAAAEAVDATAKAPEPAQAAPAPEEAFFDQTPAIDATSTRSPRRLWPLAIGLGLVLLSAIGFGSWRILMAAPAVSVPEPKQEPPQLFAPTTEKPPVLAQGLKPQPPTEPGPNAAGTPVNELTPKALETVTPADPAPKADEKPAVLIDPAAPDAKLSRLDGSKAPGKASPKPQAVAVVKPKTDAKSGRGQLRVVSTRGGEPYWASVTVDGQPKGETPLSIEVAGGKHHLRVERAGFKPVERDVVLSGGGPLVVGIELVP
jgi:serine/threonine-protein kinase